MTQTLLLMMGLFVALYIAGSFYYNNWINRFAVVTLLVCLANAIYFSLDGVKGWPAEEPTEVKGILASVVVVNPSTDDEGGIYISLFPTLPKKWYEYVYPREAPKTYFVEYSNDRAAEFELAKKAMEEGKEVRINGIPPKNGNGSSEQPADGEENSLSEVVGNFMERFLPKEQDTYKPEIPDVEILAPSVPREKGLN